MNLIDQAVEQLDFALRRRFLWIPAEYREELIVPVVGERWKAIDLGKFPWLRRHPWEEVQSDIQLLASRATTLNDAIETSNLLGAQYKVGHTYHFDAAGLIARWPDLKRPSGRRGYYLWNPRARRSRRSLTSGHTRSSRSWPSTSQAFRPPKRTGHWASSASSSSARSAGELAAVVKDLSPFQPRDEEEAEWLSRLRALDLVCEGSGVVM